MVVLFSQKIGFDSPCKLSPSQIVLNRLNEMASLTFLGLGDNPIKITNPKIFQIVKFRFVNFTISVLSCIIFFHLFITKTNLYNFDPPKPHFYIVKLGFSEVYVIFLISAQNMDCGYSLELPHRGSSNEYPQSMF